VFGLGGGGGRARSRVGGSGYRVGRLGPGPRCTVGGPAAPPGAAARVGSGRELASPFFANPIENEYFGIALFAPEPAGASGPLRPGRWVYEKKGAAKAGREKRAQRTKG